MKSFEVKQDILFVAIPLALSLVIFVTALFMSFPFNLVICLLSVGFGAYVLYQWRPMFRNFRLRLTPKDLRVLDVRGNVVRKVDWKKVDAVAVGVKRTWRLYSYNFYFRVRKEEDVVFLLLSRRQGIGAEFNNFVKVFVRKRIPVKVVKD